MIYETIHSDPLTCDDCGTVLLGETVELVDGLFMCPRCAAEHDEPDPWEEAARDEEHAAACFDKERC